MTLDSERAKFAAIRKWVAQREAYLEADLALAAASKAHNEAADALRVAVVQCYNQNVREGYFAVGPATAVEVTGSSATFPFIRLDIINIAQPPADGDE